jgi:ADP-ribose pyrophosphatase YjhB (NUDIX family)
VPIVKRKVFAYVTHGDQLFVFVHPNHPDAGIQVPAGTLEKVEDPRDGVLREATEETGLRGLEVVQFLGEQRRDMSGDGIAEIHHRYFYVLVCREQPPETWPHGELTPSDGGSTPIPFDFFWARMPDQIPKLVAGHGFFLPALVASLELGEGKALAGAAGPVPSPGGEG